MDCGGEVSIHIPLPTFQKWVFYSHGVAIFAGHPLDAFDDTPNNRLKDNE
jgi:hypothetical protein